MRTTSASDRRSTSLASYLGALALASAMALGLGSSSAFAQTSAGDRRAFELFQQGDELYKQGQFAEAAEKFRAAYALDPNPTLLYNLARCYENLGELDKAEDTYREFLERQPDATDRGAIERRIETLEQQIREKQELERAAKARKQPERPLPPPAPAEPEPSGPGALPWIVIGVGGATLIAGTVLRVMAEQKHSAAEDDPDAISADDKQQTAESLAGASDVTLIAGGVIAAVGVSWLLIGASSAEKASAPRLGVFAGLGTIALEGRF